MFALKKISHKIMQIYSNICFVPIETTLFN